MSDSALTDDTHDTNETDHGVGDEEEEPCEPLDFCRSPKSDVDPSVDISMYCNSVGVPPPKIPLVDELFVPPF